MIKTNKRLVAKTVTFKILAMTTGFLTALFFTGSKETALLVTLANSLTTLIGFYIHEHVWSKINWQSLEHNDSHKRTLIKTITYKIFIFTIGTLTKWAIIGNFTTALSVGITKNLITSVIYYFHERVWNKIKWGLNSKD
jgi:uncharacterized membrane protein